ncbi:MAG: pirin family protein [Rhodoferax sp.]|nr:pirin family protein [Rhodoferax sp.]
MPDTRAITTRTPGRRHGPITRLMSLGDIGQLIKPFVFLDYVEAPAGGGPNFGFHPHSGIVTLTYPLNFDIQHETSTGQVDQVRQGGIEWMAAGSGIWHRAQPLPGSAASGLLQGFQIWFALPPSHELAPASALFLQPEQVPVAGPVRVLLGSHGTAVSAIQAPWDLNYFWVTLRDGERWTYQPPPTHTVAWSFAQRGQLHVAGARLSRELAVFSEGNAAVTFVAEGDCGFLLGSAAPHPHALVLGPYSVHSSAAHLASGISRIAELGEQLQRRGQRS